MHPEVICLDSDSDASNSPVVPVKKGPPQPHNRDSDSDTDEELLKPTITDTVRATPFVSTCTIDLDDEYDTPSVVSKTPSPPKRPDNNNNNDIIVGNKTRNPILSTTDRQSPPSIAPHARVNDVDDGSVIIVDDDGDDSNVHSDIDADSPPKIEWDSQDQTGIRNGRACADYNASLPSDPINLRRTATKPPRNTNIDVDMTSSDFISTQSSLLSNLRAIKPATVAPRKARNTSTSKASTRAAPTHNVRIPPAALLPDDDEDDGSILDMTMTGGSTEIDIDNVNNQAVANPSADTGSSDKPKKKKKRDRDEVRIVSSAELMNIKEYKAITKRIGEMDESMLNLVFTAVDENITTPQMIEWRRTGQFDERITVDAVAYWYTATDFVELMREGKVEDIAGSLRRSYTPDVTVFIVICGIAAYCRKALKSAFNSNTNNAMITRDAIEDCVASLWFQHNIQANLFDTAKECATFLVCTAYALGRKHYATPLARSNLRDAYVHSKTSKENAALCVDSATGGVRAETSADTGAGYQAILALVPGVSADKAKTIRKVYPTLKLLLNAYRDCPDTTAAHKLLANIQNSNNNNIARKKIGPALSLKLWKVLASNDPDISIA